MRNKFLAIGVMALLLGGVTAPADTIDFTSLGVGNLGSSSLTFGGLITATGYYRNDAGGGNYEWLPANLFGRNQTNDHGIGVCNPGEGTSCGTGSGLGDINELDNAGKRELIRLALPAGYRWDWVRLSSLDGNSSGAGDDEHMQLWKDADGTPNDHPTNVADSVIAQMVFGGGSVEPTFAILGLDRSAPYLFFQPYDWTNDTNRNNDFLIWQVAVSRVPEPASLLLLGVGLLAVGGRLRRNQRQERAAAPVLA